MVVIVYGVFKQTGHVRSRAVIPEAASASGTGGVGGTSACSAASAAMTSSIVGRAVGF